MSHHRQGKNKQVERVWSNDWQNVGTQAPASLSRVRNDMTLFHSGGDKGRESSMWWHAEWTQGNCPTLTTDIYKSPDSTLPDFWQGSIKIKDGKNVGIGGFPGGPVVSGSAGDMSSIPGWGTKILHAMGQLNPSTAMKNLHDATRPQVQQVRADTAR